MKRCDASACSSASNRSSKITCWKCDKNYHLKCVGVSGNQQKVIRDCAGATWLCVQCRDLPLANDKQHPMLSLIFDRLSSIVKLIGAQIDVTRSLSRAYGQFIPRPSCCNQIPRPEAKTGIHTFEDEIDNLQFEFSSVFNSFVENSAPAPKNKRNRTSSGSSPPAVSHSEKRVRIDASVDTSDLYNVPEEIQQNINTAWARNSARNRGSVPDSYIVAESHSSRLLESSNSNLTSTNITVCGQTDTMPPTVNNVTDLPPPTVGIVPSIPSVVSGKATSICLAEARRDPTPLISGYRTQTYASITSSSPTQRITTSTNVNYNGLGRSSNQQSATINGHRSTAMATTTPSGLRINDTGLQSTTAAEFACPPTQSCDRPAVPEPTISSGSVVSSIILPNSNTNYVNDTHTPTPTLSIAPSAKPVNWFYITRFMPNETCENIIMFISKKCNCNQSLIRCHKLLRQDRDDTRPLSFLSFKLNVPESLESVITSKHFWPNGVSISPFLKRSPTRANL